MLSRFSESLNFLKSRLSRKIILWVFLSIILVEFLILLPSVYRREQELIQELEKVSLAALLPILRLNGSKVPPDQILAQAYKIIPDFPVVGGAIYQPYGQMLVTFGEKPQLSLTEIKEITEVMRFKRQRGTRHEVAWPIQKSGMEYMLCEAMIENWGNCQENSSQNCPVPQGMVLVLRLDSSRIFLEIKAYIWRIIGLVTIICIFVTFTTMLALGPTVIVPILQLRKALLAVGESKGEDKVNPELHYLTVKRTDELGEVMQAFNSMTQQIYTHVSAIKDREIQLQKLVEELGIARDQAETLLLNILPQPIAEQLKQGVYPIAESFAETTILFADIVGFTQMSAEVSPTELVSLLNTLFTGFDYLAEQHGLEKIKTIGDAYMVVGGLPVPRSNHAAAIAEMALDMQEAIRRIALQNGQPLSIRIGINTGPVVAGVIGIKKFIYDLWGDAVNTASRMESHGIKGSIHVSESTYQLLKNLYEFEDRGFIDVKGKGMMRTYLLTGRKTLSSVEF